MQPVRVVGELLAVLALDGEQILFSVNAGDLDVFSSFDAYRLPFSACRD